MKTKYLLRSKERSGKVCLFVSIKSLPAYGWISAQQTEAWGFCSGKCDPLWERETCDLFWFYALFISFSFRLLLIGKKRVHTLITSGLFTTWLSCPTDVCFGSRQHEHTTGRQIISGGVSSLLFFHTDWVTLYQTPVQVLYSFGK